MSEPTPVDLASPEAYHNRELSWLSFAGRVIAQAEDAGVPLLERVNFAGICGMLHDEFFMKRISGLKRQVRSGSNKLSLDGRRPRQEFEACSAEIRAQTERIARVVRDELRPALAAADLPILDHKQLTKKQRQALRRYVERSVMPILTPLAVDSEHPFPFISNLGLNLAVTVRDGGKDRFVRIKVPDNRPRWVPVPGGSGFVPLEQLIAANLDLLFASTPPREVHLFRLTRGAEAESERTADLPEQPEPGSIIDIVSTELKARRFAGIVRLQIEPGMPKKSLKWLTRQLGVSLEDVYPTDTLIGLSDLTRFDVAGREELRYRRHVPVVHPRIARIDATESILDEIARGDILLHHPYHDFDSSVLRFIETAAVDPRVLAIKLTIYRTSSDSPIVKALAEAARRGKQVAVLVEVTARFDEAPNIAWGQYLEKEGAHVAYGVRRLKTHVKLALVVREERDRIRRYAHVGTGNYHTGTARLYEDVGLLTSDPDVCDDVAAVFNSLTGATPYDAFRQLLVAPVSMRPRFAEMIRREAEHAEAGRPSGIYAKMNQLQDPEIIRELYRAGRAGVPIRLNVRGLCCLRPGVPGLSESIRLYSVVGRFLEHSRFFRFANGGQPEYYLGSADWMRRNLSNRVETVAPVLDERIQRELDEMIEVYEQDNCSAWDCGPDGAYVRRSRAEGEPRRAAQETFIRDAEPAAGAAGSSVGASLPGESPPPRATRPESRRRGPGRGLSPAAQPR